MIVEGIHVKDIVYIFPDGIFGSVKIEFDDKESFDNLVAAYEEKYNSKFENKKNENSTVKTILLENVIVSQNSKNLSFDIFQTEIMAFELMYYSSKLKIK